MTREDVKKIFPDATDEQITNFLNQSNSDVAKEKAKAQKLKDEAEKSKEVAEQLAQAQKELEELKQQNMTEAEKLEAERQKEKDATDKRIADLESALAEANKRDRTSKITSLFAKAGLSEEVFQGTISAFSYMPEEEALKAATSFVDNLTKLNTENLANEKAKWEQEKLKDTPNPGSEQGQGEKQKELSYAAKFARERSQALSQATEQSGDKSAPVNF